MDFLLTATAARATVAATTNSEDKIHIWTGITTLIEGLDDDLDQRRIARAMRKAFNCKSKVLVDEETQEESIKLSGNQRKVLRDWLVAAEILTPKEAAERLIFHDSSVASSKTMFILPDTPAASLAGTTAAKIHIRTQQMGRKWLTLIQDLDDDLDLKRIAREIKAVLHCSAAVVTDEVSGKEIIKLSGNQKETVREWLIASEILTEREASERLVVHGS